MGAPGRHSQPNILGPSAQQTGILPQAGRSQPPGFGIGLPHTGTYNVPLQPSISDPTASIDGTHLLHAIIGNIPEFIFLSRFEVRT